MKLRIQEDFENDMMISLKQHNYTVGSHGAYKEFPCDSKHRDFTVFVYDDGRVRYDTGESPLNLKLGQDKRSVHSIKTSRDLDKLDKFMLDFMTDYGYIDDGLELDVIDDFEYDED